MLNTKNEIYGDYVQEEKRYNDCCLQLENFLRDNFKSTFAQNNENVFHSIKGHVKSPEHLIEKIIRKRGAEHSYKYKYIDVTNYKNIVRDLVGIRVLIFAKEEWEKVFDKMIKLFPIFELAIESFKMGMLIE